jgi:predicted metal-dependent hydrolase
MTNHRGSSPDRIRPGSRAVIPVAVGGRVVDVIVRRNARAKRFILRLSVTRETATVTLPARGSLAAARDFVARHAGWLAGRLVAAAPDCACEVASLPLRGRDHLVRRSGTTRGLVRVGEEAGLPTLVVAGEAAHLRRRLVDHLIGEARSDIEKAVAGHAATLGVHPTAIRLKDPRSRWGSASTRGILNFSWRLIMAPPFVLDYVAAHEVCHLIEMNHSARFWALCHRLAPRTDEARAWLDVHGASLHRAL